MSQGTKSLTSRKVAGCLILRGDDIDLTKFPTPKFWPGDGGRYIGTGDVTFTASPDIGRINVGCYRQMLHGPRRVGLYCSPGKHGLLDREAWWKRGKPCEVVIYGIDPVMLMLAAQVFGARESELDVAGGIMGRGIELTEAETVSLPIPAQAEFVIEGKVSEGDVMEEGPLGEFPGYYGRERSPQPVIDVTALHYRKSPILTAALMAKYPSCEIGAYYAIMRSARVLDDLERIGVPGVVGAYAHPAAASGWGIVRRFAAAAVCRSCFSGLGADRAMSRRRFLHQMDCRGGRRCGSDRFQRGDVGAVDALPSVRGYRHFEKDLVDGIDPSQFEMERRSYGSKALISSCKPHRHLKQFPQTTRLRREVYQRVAARWNELGFSGQPPEKLTTFHGD